MVWTNFNIFDLFVRVCVLLFFITTWHDDPRWHPLPIYFFGLIHLPSNAVVFLLSVLSQRHSEFGLESMDRLPCRSWSQLSGNFHQIAAFDIPVLEEKSSLDVEARLMRQLSVCHLCKPRTLWHNMNRLVSNVVGLKGPEPLFAVCILFFAVHPSIDTSSEEALLQCFKDAAPSPPLVEASCCGMLPKGSISLVA